METRTTRNGLVVRSQTLRFSQKAGQPGESKLWELLRQQRDTRPVPISSETDLLLGRHGELQGKYRLTSVALTQICAALAPGLSQVILSIAGVRQRNTDYPDEEYSQTIAIKILNEMIRLRFDLIRHQSLIIDERAKVVEGLVGPKYRFLSNYDLLERIRSRLGNDSQFYGAAVAGRRLVARFTQPECCFAIPTPRGVLEPFQAGWHFSNSELGDSRVKATAMLVRGWTGTASLTPFSKQALLVHFQGPTFENKFSKLFDLVQTQVNDLSELGSHMTALKSRSLGFTGTVKNYTERLDRLGKALSEFKIGNRISKDAIARTLLLGSYRADRIGDVGDGQPETPDVTPSLLTHSSSRNFYDLYNALCAVAQRASPDQQEHVEQAAFRLMTNPNSLLF